MTDYQSLWRAWQTKVCSILLILSILLAATLFHFQSVKAASAARPFPWDDNPAVTTYHNDTFRTGENLFERKLNVNNVNAQQFGKRVTYAVDGQIYAQPLYLPNLWMQGRLHNVVYVATENDSVYAFDADQTSAGLPLWHTNFTNAPNVTPVPSGDLYNGEHEDISPQVGITSTPVIDVFTGTIFVVAMTKENGTYHQRLHALSLFDGREMPNSPIEIQAQVPGTGTDNVNGIVSFNPKTNLQRSALLLSRGVIYIAWASFGDVDPTHYHGWVMGYTYRDFHFHQASIYNDTPNGSEGGIWMGGSGPSADAEGNVYVSTGNGNFDLNSGGPDSGNTDIKFSTDGGFHVADYFTPFNQSCLNALDQDLGSGGILLLPNPQGSTHPPLLLSIGKEARPYIVNRDNMGQYVDDPKLTCGYAEGPEELRTNVDNVYQELPPKTTGSLFGSAAYWAGTKSTGQMIFVGAYGGNGTYGTGPFQHVEAFSVNENGTMSTTATSIASETIPFGGANPSISSNGTQEGTGIVWTITATHDLFSGIPAGAAILHAYDATDLAHELYTSEQNGARDGLDDYVQFSIPTIAHGKVFVGTATSLTIFGLLPS